MPAFFKSRAKRQRSLAAQLRGLANNASAPPEVLIRLTAAVNRSELARHRALPAQAAAVLAADREVNVRSQLAANPNLSAEVQVVLAKDADSRVRGRLAEGAEYFTTCGVHGRQFPGPLPREVYELLARDPEPKVRRALASNRHLPDDIRSTMLDDGDAQTAAIAAAEWNPAPTARIGELLSRATGSFARKTVLLRLDGPLPAETARGMLTEIEESADPADSAGLLRQIAETADLDTELTDRFLADPHLRAAVAANPTLAPEHVAALAQDPDNQVRAAIVARRGLDPELRESTAVEYDDRDRGNAVGWLPAEDLSDADQIAFARSRHQVFRKTLAMRTDLSDEVVAILAADESFAVRLFVCERQPNAPGWLLAQTAAAWGGYSRWDMLAHKNFPADAATGLARSGASRDRAVAAAHPGLPAEAIEALLTDDEDWVRRHQRPTRPFRPADSSSSSRPTIPTSPWERP